MWRIERQDLEKDPEPLGMETRPFLNIHPLPANSEPFLRVYPLPLLDPRRPVPR